MQLPSKWAAFFAAKPETGMGYHVGDVTLVDGTTFQDVLFVSGYVTQVRGFPEVPFAVNDIASIAVTGRRWRDEA